MVASAGLGFKFETFQNKVILLKLDAHANGFGKINFWFFWSANPPAINRSKLLFLNQAAHLKTSRLTSCKELVSLSSVFPTRDLENCDSCDVFHWECCKGDHRDHKLMASQSLKVLQIKRERRDGKGGGHLSSGLMLIPGRVCVEPNHRISKKRKRTKEGRRVDFEGKLQRKLKSRAWNWLDWDEGCSGFQTHKSKEKGSKLRRRPIYEKVK